MKKEVEKTTGQKPNYRKKRTNAFRKDKDQRDDVPKKHVSADNDVSWYLVKTQSAADIASFSYNTPTGPALSLAPFSADSPSGSIYIPGICVLYNGPAVGYAQAITDPVNQAAINVYSFVRHANSGHSNYDPTDLMIYLLAADSIFAYWSWMCRVLGTCNAFSKTNRYIGDALIDAYGVNPNDIRKNIPGLRAYINDFATRASVWAVPNTMPYFLKHSWMYQNVYKDEDTEKAQMYLYNPAYLWKFANDSSNLAGKLEPILISGTIGARGFNTAAYSYLGLYDIMEIGNAMLNAMASQEDIGIMSGDILKAYGSEKLFRFTRIPDDYAVIPTFSEEVLEQIHNTDFAGSAIVSITPNSEGVLTPEFDIYKALSVTQNVEVGNGVLQFMPNSAGKTNLCCTRILDFWREGITPEQALVAARNKIGGIVDSSLTIQSFKITNLVAIGSEMVLWGRIMMYDATGNLGSVVIAATDSTNTGLTYAGKFNEFPMQYIVSNNMVSDVAGEINNFTLLSLNNIRTMHTSALLGLFGVPYEW